jgi:hypothetical protein
MLQNVITRLKVFFYCVTLVSCVCMMLACYSPNKQATNTNKKVAGISSNHSAMLQTQGNTYTNKHKVVHVVVALCDNLHQGIEPVPKGIGNGQDPSTNLYWGCDYGVKTFFKNLTGWKLVATIHNSAPHILERCIFKQPSFNSYMVADAYDGAYIKNTMADFCNASAGAANGMVVYGGDTLGILGNANMIAYIGHEGLMDVSLDSVPAKRDARKRDAVILACESKQYWGRILAKTGSTPLLWTTQLMCPEAYTLDAAITGWLNNETNTQIHQRAAQAYSKYQKCSVKAAGQLLATGF